MSKTRIEYPFQSAFQEFRKAKTIDIQKNLFKGLLEAYVKFNAAFHAGWLLKELKSEIPMNLRVQLVQMYQKPPSLGFCNAMSAMVNRIILKSQNNKSLWIDFAKDFDQNQEYLQKLIKLRNQDAHASIVLNKDHIAEMKACFEIILNSPFYRKTSLIVADAHDIGTARIVNTKGLVNLNQPLIVIKPDLVYNNEEWSLDGSELCLMPFVLGKRNSDAIELNYSLVFWNQRNGDKGVFQNYLSSETQNIEVDNITNLSGFPYEDWKKMANPIYLNYLKSKTAALEEMLEDEKVGIQQWYEEILVARKLEKELQIVKDEQISDYDYGSGLSAKLKNVLDREHLTFFHNRIIELRNSDFSVLSNKESESLVDVIYDSIVFLFHDAVKRKDRVQYNLFFKMAIVFIPQYFYIRPALGVGVQLTKLIDIKRFNFEGKLRMLLSFLVFLGVPVGVFFLLDIYFAIGSVLILVILFAYYSLNILKQRFKKLLFENAGIRRIKFFITTIILQLNKNANVFGLTEILSEMKNVEFAEIVGVHLNYNEENWINSLILRGEISDFKAIVIRRNFIFLKIKKLDSVDSADVIWDYRSSIREEFAYFNERREKFKKGFVDSQSKNQEIFLLSNLNEIFYLEDILLLHIISKGIVGVERIIIDTKSFNRILFVESNSIWDKDRHNFLFGAISFYSQDLALAIEFWEKVKYYRNYVLIARYNIAMTKGALGRVNEFYEDLFILSQDLDDECPEDVKVLVDWVDSRLKHSKRDIRDYTERESVKINMKITSGDNKPFSKESKVPFYKSNYSWTGHPSFTIWNGLPNIPKVFQKFSVKYEKQNQVEVIAPIIKGESSNTNAEIESNHNESNKISLKSEVPSTPTKNEVSAPLKENVTEREKRKMTMTKDDNVTVKETSELASVKIPLGKKMKGMSNLFWAQENLDVAFFRNGDPVPQVKDKTAWAAAHDSKQPAWCYYKNDNNIGVTEGKLYNWYAVIDSRGLAPEGWRVASADDWDNLIEFYGSAEKAFKGISNEEGWKIGSRRKETGTFSNSSYNGWWSSSGGRLNGYCFEKKGGTLVRESYPRGMGFPVICVRE